MADLPVMTASLEAALARLQPTAPSPFDRLRGLVALDGAQGRRLRPPRSDGLRAIGLPVRNVDRTDSFV